MLDENKVNKLLIIILTISFVVSFSFGYSFGHHKATPSSRKDHVKKTKSLNNPQKLELRQDIIKEFLIAYFTKKDLGENRNRYMPFLTEEAFEKEINLEELPSNKTYTGYVVDQEFKEAEIFINQEKLEAIVNVSYVNTILSKKEDYSNAQKDVSHQLTLKLYYQKINNDFKVSKMETIMILNNNEQI